MHITSIPVICGRALENIHRISLLESVPGQETRAAKWRGYLVLIAGYVDQHSALLRP